MPRRIALPLVIAIATLVTASSASAQETSEGEAPRRIRPQNNEVDFQADVIFQAGATRYSPDNVSHITLGYVWFPGTAMDKNDVVVPMLRRFVRRPLELGLRYERQSDQFDSINGLIAHGTYWPIEMLYVRGGLGLELDEPENALGDSEGSFWTHVVRGEAGVRVLDLLQLGAFYHRRTLFETSEPDGAGIPAERAGGEQWVGLSLGFATPDDRLLVAARAGYRDTAWDFSGFHPGELNVDGVFTEARLSYQANPTTSYYLRADLARESWEETRALGLDGEGVAIPPRRADVTAFNADLGFIYWFEGKWGFRVSLGGGYTDPVPIEGGRETGRIRFGLGFTSRY